MSYPPLDKKAALKEFRAIPERCLGNWRYRLFGTGTQTLVLVPGGELVNDFGFEFALAIGKSNRVLYAAYPPVSSIEELTDGLCSILKTEMIEDAAILGASFGGAFAQVFVRRHPDRVTGLLLSNTGVPLKSLVWPVHVTYFILKLLPWSLIAKLLRKPLLVAVDPSGADRTFWDGYLNELFTKRLSKSDVLLNSLVQLGYHRSYRFRPEDLRDWRGKVLIAESDTDIIGPKRRKALRESYPQAEVRTFHNAGHAPMFTRFAEYLQMVQEFLRPGYGTGGDASTQT